MQRFVSEPTNPINPASSKFPYCVARFNEIKSCYVQMEHEIFSTQQESEKRASELNREYQEECNEN